MKYLLLILLLLTACNEVEQTQVMTAAEKTQLKTELLKPYEEYKKKVSEKDFTQSLLNIEDGITQARRLHEIKLKGIDDQAGRDKQERILNLTIQKLNREKADILQAKQEIQMKLATLKTEAESEYKKKTGESF